MQVGLNLMFFVSNFFLYNYNFFNTIVVGSSSDDDDDREENLGLSEANVDGAGEGIGVCRTTPWTTWSPCSVTCMALNYLKNFLYFLCQNNNSFVDCYR